MEAETRERTQSNESSLRAGDYLLLLLLCSALYGFALIYPRVFTTHETTHCQNVVEMFRSGEWLIPTYGGRPWLERPFLPHWITGVCAVVLADVYTEWALRVGSILVAIAAVLVLAWAVASAFGRFVGLLAGAILATMREFASYATGPEADIFLCSIVTITGAFFIRAEFGSPAINEQRRWSFFGGRSGYVFGFFLGLGFTNLAKGPLFGASFLLSSLGVYYLWSRDWKSLGRYVWFWGWLAAIVFGSIWPAVAYSHHPDVIELWLNDYGKRWNQGYIGEPAWYYLLHQPWNIFPWTFVAVLGFYVTARQIRDRAENNRFRFIWCWAVIPVVLFSCFQGKHHHYMLNCLAPWAVLAAWGAMEFWRWAHLAPKWWRNPLMGLILIGLPGSVLILLFGKKIPGPSYVVWTLVIGWPICITTLWWLVSHPQGRIAAAGCCVLIVLVNHAAYMHRTHFLDRYAQDKVFIRNVPTLVPDGEPIYVLDDVGPLDPSWKLFYLKDRSRLLHNITFLRDDRISTTEIYLLCRKFHEEKLQEYGQPEQILQSAFSRAETGPADRLTLYRLKFHANLQRVSAKVRITPLQATGRAQGPFLHADSGRPQTVSSRR